jgi:hypothetical protein
VEKQARYHKNICSGSYWAGSFKTWRHASIDDIKCSHAVSSKDAFSKPLEGLQKTKNNWHTIARVEALMSFAFH